jgi:hypothetical protein
MGAVSPVLFFVITMPLPSAAETTAPPLCGASGRPLRIVRVREPLATGRVPMSVF